jgi:hypothetical protein
MLQDVRRRAGLSFSCGDRALKETTRVLAVDRATSGRHRHPCCFREYAATPPVCATSCRLDGIRSLSRLYSKSGLICRLHAESLNVMKEWKRIVASWCSRMSGYWEVAEEGRCRNEWSAWDLNDTKAFDMCWSERSSAGHSVSWRCTEGSGPTFLPQNV